MSKRLSKTSKIATNTIQHPQYIARDVSSFIPSIRYFLTKRLATMKESHEQITSSQKRKKGVKQFIPIGLLLLFIGGIVIISGRMISASSKSQTPQDTRTTIKGPKASVAINKEFSFPIRNEKGKEVTKIKYIIENAELRDEIIVQGSKATAVSGRTFLIFTIKLINDYDKAIDLRARDYVRLTLNGNEQELLAADIHNDPVNIQPISTKITRLGFPINDTDMNIVLKVGEISGEKESIEVIF